MREFVKYADNLVRNIKVKEICFDVIEKLKFASKYNALSYLLEDIFNETQESDLLLQLAEIHTDFLDNSHKALFFIDKYFLLTNPKLYKLYHKMLIQDKNYSLEFKHEHNFENKLLCNFACRYTCVLAMMSYLHSLKKYNIVLELYNYAEQILNEYKQNTKDLFYDSATESIKKRESELSSLLGITEGNIEISRLAIRYNKQNETPYLLILQELLNRKDYAQALKFYNEEYVEAFSESEKFEKEVDVIWFMAEKKKDVEKYYESVLFQKMAITYELES